MTDREELVNSSDDILLDWHRTALASATGLSYWPQLLVLVSDKSILQQKGTIRSHSYRNPYILCFRSSWTTTCCGPCTKHPLPSSNNRTQQQAAATAATASLSEAENSPRTSTRTDSENHSQLR